MKKLLVIALLACLCLAKLQVYSPKSLKKEVGDKKGYIPMSIANFGLVPYGHTIMSKLKFVSDNDEGCVSFNNTLKSEGEQSPIAIIRRGGCSFVTKVRNAEHGGAQLAIIVDEVDGEYPDQIIMVDDGTGNGIQIPSVLIGKTDGEALISKYASLSASGKNIQLLATFEINRPDDRVEYEFWFSSSNDRGLDFIRDFKSYHEKLGKKVLMTPRYFSWDCIDCDTSITETDCLCGGKYCALDENNLRIEGKQILTENLRQKCIYNLAMSNDKIDTAWWTYVTKAHSRCYNDFTEECSKEIHTELGMDYQKTLECVNNSFSNKDNVNEGTNSILEAEVKAWSNHGAHYIPSVIINSVAYRGDLDPENVFAAICNGFKDAQEECKAYVDNSYIEATKDKVTFNWFILVIVFLIVLNVALLLICKRVNQRSMKQEVNDAVNDYMKLRQGNVELSDKP